MGAIVRLHHAQTSTRQELGELHDPLFIVGQAFRRFLELAGCSDQEAADWMNRMTRSDRVRPVHIRRWAEGNNSPPADYFLVALWLAGPPGLEVLNDLLKLSTGADPATHLTDGTPPPATLA